MKNKNIGIWLAVIALFALIGLLIYISLNTDKNRSQQINNLTQSLNQSNEEIKNLKNYIKYNPPKDGMNGVNGLNGHNGRNGMDGHNGIDGNSGKNGLNGNSGDSAYQVWLQAGNTGTITEFLDSLKGDDASPAREIQMRCNPKKLQNEWRYVGDSVANPLDKVNECAPGSEIWR